MAKFAPADIRNFALIGHSGTGKTILSDAILAAAGAIKKVGSVESGTTQSDSQPEEKSAGRSIYNSVFSVEKGGTLYNFIDSPGYLDFAAQPLLALSAVESALIVVNAANPIELGTRKAWEYAERLGVAKMIVVNRLDEDNADFEKAVEELRGVFGQAITPVAVPDASGPSFSSVRSLLGEDVPEEYASVREQLVENIVSADDAVLEKYLETGEVSPEDLQRVFGQAVASGAVVPVVPAAGLSGAGVEELLQAVRNCLPGADRPCRKVKPEEGEETVVPVDGKLRAFVFRVAVNEFIGKISVFRIFSGELKAGDSVKVLPDGGGEKIQKLYRLRGDEQQEVSSASAGEIVATAKADKITLQSTLASDASEAPFTRLEFPEPLVSRAVSTTKSGDEGKVGDLLRRIAEEDPSFRFGQDPQTKELIISASGEQHLRAVFERLKLRNKMELEARVPKIPYKETITSSVEHRYRHKKQTGGAGQFAECAILLEPAERGEGYEFIDKIFGGAISQQYRPSVDKGIQEAMKTGVLAGYPVVDVRVTLTDGKEHPVDSGDIPFQIAGRQCFWEAMEKASPVLLEPVVKVEVTVPSKYMGDVTSDLASRRGRVTGMDTVGEMQVIKAEVPLAEMQTYSSQLQGLTQGEGFFSMEFSHYEPVPHQVAQTVIEQAKRAREAQKEG